MLKLKEPQIVPPLGFRYHDEDLKYTFRGSCIQDLAKRCIVMRQANGLLTPPDFEAVIEDWLCRRLPEKMVYSDNPDEPVITHPAITYFLVQGMTKHVIEAYRKAGRRFTTSEEMSRRAAICMNCPQNRKHATCMNCDGLKDWVNSNLGGRMKEAEGLLVCDILAVFNSSHTRLPDDVIKEITTIKQLAMLPDECWRKQLVQGEDHE